MSYATPAGKAWRPRLVKYSPDQPRDEHGEWTDGGGGGFQPEPWQTTTPRLLSPEAFAQSQAARDWATEHVHGSAEGTGSYVAGSTGLNGALRDGDAPPEFMSEIAPVIAATDKAIAGSTVDTATVAYRGQDPSFLAGVRVGDTFTDKGYVSTSLLQRVTRGFGDRVTPIEIHIPSGSHVAAPSDRMEHELILPRDSTFRVDAIGTRPVLTYLGA